MDQARFSVCQFFPDDSYEYVRRSVNLDEAVEAFSNCVVATSTKRVIVTNGQVSLEWKSGEGITRKAGIAV
jgi:hypothetical protein